MDFILDLYDKLDIYNVLKISLSAILFMLMKPLALTAFKTVLVSEIKNPLFNFYFSYFS